MRNRILISAAVALAGAVFAMTSQYQSSPQSQSGSEKPWTSYGGHADSSRYFDSKQITKQNVQQLQVAWSYSSGETVFHPLVAHGTVYGRGRNGSLVALDAR